MKHSTLDDLELQILKAHALGDRETLERLQERYRSEVSGGIREVERPGPGTQVRDIPPPQLRDPFGRPPASSEPLRSSSKIRKPTSPMVRQIVLTRRAREEMSGFVHGITSPDGSWLCMETGGCLLGRVAGSSIVVDAAPEISAAQRSRYSVRWSYDDVTRLEKVYRRSICGDWHLHPGSRVPEPSGQDRDGWGKIADAIGHPWAGIILGDSGSSYWPMKAWVATYRDGKLRTYPVPLLVEE